MASKFKRPDVCQTKGHTNYGRMSRIIVELCRDAMWEVLTSKIPIDELADLIRSNTSKLYKLHSGVLTTFTDHYVNKTLPSNTDVDITALYTIIRNVVSKEKLEKKQEPPTNGWGKSPGEKDFEESDDLERIRILRNDLQGHITSASIKETDYKAKFSQVEQIMKRLDVKLHTSFSHSLITIDQCCMDPEMEEKYIELLRKQQDYDEETRNMVTSTHSKLLTIEDQLAEIRTSQLKSEKKEDINLTQNTAITGTWRKQRDSFVDTRAYRHVRSEVLKNNFTTIIGNSGSGKSAIAQNVALELEKDGYTIYPIKTVEDLKTYIDPKTKQVFVLNDPVGTVSIDEHSLTKFQSYNQLVSDMINDYQIKVVITCRKAIMNDKRVQTTHTMISRNIVDINRKDLNLTSTERKNMFDHYVRHVEINLPEKSKNSIINLDIDSFPLLCQLYGSNANFRKLGEAFFFDDMLKHLIYEIKVIQYQHKIQFCCLVLCLFYDNEFDTDILDVFSNVSENKTQLNQIIEASGLSSYVSRQEIQNEMEGLEGVYFIKEGTRFRFLHDSIYDSVSYVFGSHHPNKTLEVCSSSFIRERVRLKQDSECTDGMYIVLNSKSCKLLAERLFKELERGNFFDVFLCPFITEIQEQLTECFRNKPRMEICTLIESKINSDLLQNYITQEIERNSLKWYFLDILSSSNTKLIHWILAMGLQELFTFVYEQYKNFRSESIDHNSLNLLPIACLSGNTEITKMLLHKKDKNVLLDKWDACYDRKLSTLHMAVFSNNESTVKYLINEKILTNIETEHGRTPLYVGAAIGVTSICRILIKHGADVKRANTNGFTPLHIASVGGHIDIVKVLIENGADVNTVDNNGDTPLYTAAGDGQIDIVKVLIENGADVNIVNNDGDTPLYMAALFGHIDMVNVLIENRADVNIVSNDGFTPLYTAYVLGQIDIVKVLIENRADVNIVYNNGDTPLYRAAVDGHIDIVKVLIEKGADVNIVNNDGNRPLYRAAADGHIDIVKVLIEKGADVNIVYNNGDTPLYRAAVDGHIDIVKVLIEKGADVNIVNNDGNRPLYRAAADGHIDIVKVLIEKGADVNIVYNNGDTPLYRAAVDGHIDIVKVLIENGADVNKVDNDGDTPLYTASILGQIDIVKVLIENGADVNIVYNNGDTPLYTASILGQIDIVKVLIEKGADVNIISNNGDTPLYTAAADGHIDIVKVLIENDADVNIVNNNCNRPLYRAAADGHIDIVKVLIENDADVNIVNNNGIRPLYRAAADGHIDIVKVLIENGADVNIVDNDGDTPLYTASILGQIDIVKVLIENGADVNIVDNDGDTPLYRAAADGHIDIAKVFIEKCADVNIVNNDGDTPLHIASHKGNIDIVKVLIEKCADVNIIDNNGDTPLCIAAGVGHIEIVKVLINKGADVNIVNNDGDKPLYIASQNGHFQIIKSLIDDDADINMARDDGSTPLFIASQNNHFDIVKFLIDNGANANITDSDGRTPFMIASQENHIDIIDYLSDKDALSIWLTLSVVLSGELYHN